MGRKSSYNELGRVSERAALTGEANMLLSVTEVNFYCILTAKGMSSVDMRGDFCFKWQENQVSMTKDKDERRAPERLQGRSESQLCSSQQKIMFMSLLVKS